MIMVIGYYLTWGDASQFLHYFHMHSLFRLSIRSSLFTLILACLLFNIFVVFLLTDKNGMV